MTWAADVDAAQTLCPALRNAPHPQMRPRPCPADSAQIETLPDELLQLVFELLPTSALKEAALVSKCFSRHATDFLWHNVCLMDEWKLHLSDDTRHLYGDRGQGEPDEHDDTPILCKLYILATYASLP